MKALFSRFLSLFRYNVTGNYVTGKDENIHRVCSTSNGEVGSYCRTEIR